MKPSLILSAVTLSAVAAYALASNDDAPNPQGRAAWLPKQAIAAQLEQQGYRVHHLEADDGCVEAYVSDPSGRRGELYVEPTTGMPGCRGKYRDGDD